MVNVAKREVLFSNKMLGRGGWGLEKMAQPNRDGCACLFDAGFNAGSLRSFNWLIKYGNYLQAINRNTKIIKTVAKEMRFVLWVRNLETHCAMMYTYFGRGGDSYGASSFN